MPIFYRYLIREVLTLFFATNLILMSILLSFRLSSLLSAATAGKLSLNAVWELVMLQGMRFLLVLMPLAFILATTMALGRFYRDSEITAAFACGIAPKNVRFALLFCAIPIAIILISLNLFVMPHIYQQQENLRERAQQEAGLLLFSPKQFRRLDDETVIYTQDIKAGRLEHFFIARQEKDGQSVITARVGELHTSEDGRHLVLQNGGRLTWANNFLPTETTLTQFERADLRLPEENFILNHERLRNVPTNKLGTSPEHLSEWQVRFNPALALVLFTLFLPWLAKTKPRTGRYQKVLPTFLIFALYINGLDLLAAAVKKGKIPAFPGSFSLHLFALGLFLFLLFMQREKRKC